MIYSGIDELASNLNILGFQVEKIEPQESMTFILDAEKNELVIPNSRNRN
ncbi:MAG: hypothetical protein K2J20_02715 [Bacilli bacterium]|nr:hypothetical protein [Bacilli bacterium]